MNAKTIFLFFVMFAVNTTVVVPLSLAVTYDTAEQVVTIKYNPENHISISGNPGVLEIKKAGPEGIVNSNNTSMDWSVDNKGVKKITAVLSDLYNGIELKVRITSGIGELFLSNTPVDVVTNLKGSTKVGQEIVYTATADISTPTGEQSRIVIFTLIDQ